MAKRIIAVCAWYYPASGSEICNNKSLREAAANATASAAAATATANTARMML